MTTVTTALVIGGGIAGPATALALRKAGIEATVHEAYAEPADGVGGILTIASNGMAVLDLLGIGDAVRAIGEPMPGMAMADNRGRTIVTLKNVSGLQPGQAVWRSEIYRALQDAMTAQGIRVEYNKRLTGYTETADGVTAHFADGTTATADILIGADGIRSTVRGLLDPAAPDAEYVGILGFGGFADGVDVPGEPDTMYFVMGRRAFLGYWGESGQQIKWFSNLPSPKPYSFAEAREVPKAEWLRQLREAYAGDIPGEALLANIDADQLFVLGALEILPKVPTWHRGRVVLVGDAVHAPSPSSGQGASLSLESAVQLARCLRDLPDAESAFAAYERLRRPRVEKIAEAAARTNRSKAPGAVAKLVMRVAMPMMIKLMNLEKRMAEELGYRIDWDEAVVSDVVPALH